MILISSLIKKVAGLLPDAPRRVLISTPHSYCRGHHECDDLSLHFAKMLERCLEKEGLPTKIIPANVLRKDMDLNRIRSRGTAFRKKLEEYMVELNLNDVMLDVHSAPTCGFDVPFEVLFLHMEENNRFLFELNRYLRDQGINSYVMEGTYDNDILLMARHGHGLLNCALVEINRDLQDGEMMRVAEKMSNFLGEYDG